MEDNNSVDLTIKFPNKKALIEFAEWLCGQGEQDYWVWQDCQDDPSTVTFHYHGVEDETKSKSDPKRYQGFVCDNTIRTTLR